jgi:hypothetical protein
MISITKVNKFNKKKRTPPSDSRKISEINSVDEILHYLTLKLVLQKVNTR